jgi:outer membrane protein assembly factor BamB
MIGTLLCCLDTSTGKTLWEYKISAGCMNGSPALWKDRLYISQSVRHGAIPIASRILCLDARTGTIIWQHPGGGITGPVVAAGKVYFASTSDPFFYCVDAEGNGDGTTTCLWRYDMGERVYESVPAIYAGRAFILSESGWLYAFT